MPTIGQTSPAPKIWPCSAHSVQRKTGAFADHDSTSAINDVTPGPLVATDHRTDS